MNLIGHYTCAAVPSPEVRAGAVLPDLVSLYRRRVRPLVLAQAWREDAGPGHWPPGMDALLAGVDFHHAVDARFHRAPVFRETADAIQAALLEASRAPGLKRFLPAHVLTELFLDHLLLRRDPGLARAFYRDVSGATALMTTFVARHPLAEEAGFRGFLRHIVAGRFVDAYEHPAGLFDRMNRILLRFGQRTLEPAEQAAVAAYWRRAAEGTEAQLERFLQAMHGLAPQQVLDGSAADWRAMAARQWAAGQLSVQFA